MEQTTQAKDKIKAGTELNDLIIKAGGLWTRDQMTKLKKVRVPTLTLSFPRKVIRNYWSAFWGGHQLPLQVVVDGKVDRGMWIGRLSFATTFIVADSFLLVGRFGTWLLKKMIPGLSAWHVAVVAVGAVGFIGWVLPRFLEGMGFMQELDQTKTMQALGNVDLAGMIPQVSELSLGWLALVLVVGMIGAVPFSVARFKKWRGFKALLGKKTKPIIGDDQ